MHRAASILAALLCGIAPRIGAGQPYDVVIAAGTVVDGSGVAGVRADVAIRDGRIAVIGSIPAGSARTCIDAAGKVVAPGFIDIHTHARGGIFETPTAENYVRQGVTTLIEGQDGGAPVPLAPFLKRMSATRISVNFGMLAGQGSIRQAVIGLENRRGTTAEIERMKSLVREAMRAGAFGLSTGLFYVPGNYTPTEEVIELAREAGALGGVHISHMRDEAAGVLDSVRETIRIGEEGRLPTQVTHHKIIGRANWGKSVETLRLVREARARGVDVTLDQYPYTASSTGTAALFPQWALEGGRAALRGRLADPKQRSRIKAGIIDRIQNDRGGGDPKNVVMADCPFDGSAAGLSLADLTKKADRAVTIPNAAETAMEIEALGGCQAVFHAISEQDLERILRFPFTMIASDGEIPRFGEGAPHPRSYGTFARVLGRYVRERKTLSLEEAVKKMTSLPAARLKLKERGLLKPGMRADVVVFDPAVIADKATFDKPHQYAVGVSHVFVNGAPALADGKITRERPGMILYGPAKGER